MSIKKPYKQNPYLNNSLSPSEFFNERIRFAKLYPKPKPSKIPTPIDFWDKGSTYYGLMDQRKNFIVPDPFYLQQVSTFKGRTHFALPFVAEAYRDFQRFMVLDLSKKLVDDEHTIKTQIVVQKGWKDYEEVQEELSSKNYKAFVNTILGQRHSEVENVEDFMRLFFNNYVPYMTDAVPLTTQGLIQNKFIGPEYSGLCIEIDAIDKSDGYTMFNRYVNNYNFQTYLMTAAKFGFMVDKNVPYRLVANLSSPKMLAYAQASMKDYLSTPRESQTGDSSLEWTGPSTVSLAVDASGFHTHNYVIDEYGNGYTEVIENPFNPGKVNHRHEIVNFKVQEAQGWDYIDNVAYGIQPHTHDLPVSENPEPFTTDRMLNLYFSEIAGLDVIRIRNTVLDYYNRYVAQFPTAVSQVPCGNYGSRSVTIERSSITKEDFDSQFPMSTFLKMYFMIRLVELKIDLPEAVIRANNRKIENLYFTIDSAKALEYIQQYLKQFY